MVDAAFTIPRALLLMTVLQVEFGPCARSRVTEFLGVVCPVGMTLVYVLGRVSSAGSGATTKLQWRPLAAWGANQAVDAACYLRRLAFSWLR